MIDPIMVYPQPCSPNRVVKSNSGSDPSGEAEEIARRAEAVARRAEATANRALNMELASDYNSSSEKADLYLRK